MGAYGLVQHHLARFVLLVGILGEPGKRLWAALVRACPQPAPVLWNLMAIGLRQAQADRPRVPKFSVAIVSVE